jgi:hypothetical protein
MAPDKNAKHRVDMAVPMVSGWIPDALIAFVAMKLTDDEWSTFWWVWVAIQVFYFLNWVKKVAWGSLVWRLWLRRRVSDEALSILTACQFPKPEDGNEDIQTFFTRLIDDDEQPVGVRVRAAEWRATIHTNSEQGGLLAGMRLQEAWGNALAAFDKT